MRAIDELLSDYKATLWNVHPMLGGYAGLIRLTDCRTCTVMWGYDEDGYEHVSVAPVKRVIPSWDDMAELKNIFFYDEEEAYQIMPKNGEYVNIKTNCLHLWRPKNGKCLGDLVTEVNDD